ncbi:MAG: DNA-3-methyladenine glycosylase [Burkholderiaceae bacterium]
MSASSSASSSSPLGDAAGQGEPPPFWIEARDALGRTDPVMRALIARPGPPHLVLRSDPFQTLARSIVGQQISVKAAQSVWNRCVALVGTMTPLSLLAQQTEALRACGLSYRKIEYLVDLCIHFDSGAIDAAEWPRMSDEDIIRDLTGIRGIGRWTAEMFLIFNLLRPDVYPLDDIGLLNALSAAYEGGARISRAQALHRGEAWRPWRSVATWYLWRSLDPLPVEY